MLTQTVDLSWHWIYVSPDVDLDVDNCKFLFNIEQQSPDIALGTHGHLTKKLHEEIGAGDQGHMFGYGTDETLEFMFLTHVLATQLGARFTEMRNNKTCPWLRPDGKTQMTVEYQNEGGHNDSDQGKDPTKVDRSGAYIVRQAANGVVASACHYIVQVSCAIGVPEPLSLFMATHGTGKIPDKDILELIKENFHFGPEMIAFNLDLKQGGNFRYQKTAA
ncbi:hypothetical protein SLEP1_g20008 [Rubroshorea leprosula]|uniref:methionine adenosyltransferase n=1 Tax=Rubroshorea leprosula TaxID=152421 RepID=A0AAV5JA57_9ROSI|nr:hypothetical protein SLEP1_g20008 [Rubroshorea leprosula]